MIRLVVAVCHLSLVGMIFTPNCSNRTMTSIPDFHIFYDESTGKIYIRSDINLSCLNKDVFTLFPQIQVNTCFLVCWWSSLQFYIFDKPQRPFCLFDKYHNRILWFPYIHWPINHFSFPVCVHQKQPPVFCLSRQFARTAHTWLHDHKWTSDSPAYHYTYMWYFDVYFVTLESYNTYTSRLFQWMPSCIVCRLCAQQITEFPRCFLCGSCNYQSTFSIQYDTWHSVAAYLSFPKNWQNCFCSTIKFLSSISITTKCNVW